MKDNAAWACLLLCWLPLGAGGQAVVNNGGQFFLNAQPGLQGMIRRNGIQNGKPELMPEASSDVLEFVDGSDLHGQMTRMDPEHGLTWVNPEARNPINFRPAHLDFVRFAHAQSVSLSPTCHLWFANGDDLYGSIATLDNEHVDFRTWFGGSMVIPREAVRAITFLSTHYSVSYEGPYDEGGWVVINNSPKSWTFHDGAFIGDGPGTLGRDLNLTNSTTVEFDLAWSGVFSLEVGIYCDVMDRLEVNGGSCVVALTPGKVSLRQIQNMGMPFDLAGVPVPESEGKSRMHVAIECDKAAATVTVFINHLLIKTWKDCNFQGSGTGLLFLQQPNMFTSSILKLSHLKVSQWEGRAEPESFNAMGTNDAIHFINHDRAVGNIESIQDGKARLNLAGTSLDIPLARVTQMEFAAAKTPVESPGPWQVRAHFPGGGSVSFQLEKWDDKVVSGRSAIFGTLAFQAGAIREMEFNLSRPKEETVAGENKEFEGLDE
jgi:hypothetical protein